MSGVNCHECDRGRLCLRHRDGEDFALPDETPEPFRTWAAQNRLRSACEAMSRFLVWVEMEAWARSSAREYGYALYDARHHSLAGAIEDGDLALSWPAPKGESR